MRMLFSIFVRIQARVAAGRIVLLGFCVASVLFAVGCEGKIEKTYDLLTEYDRNFDYYPDKSWLKASSPELLGWSSEKLGAAREYTLALNTSAVLIVQNGVVVDAWGSPEVPYKVHSVRKSLMNALYGIHVAAGNIQLSETLAEIGIDDWKPPLSPEEKQAQVGDLLQARSGVYHPAAYETYNMRTQRPLPGSYAPGSHWFYNNWDFNALITIFEKKTGRRMEQEFRARIAEPLGMEDFRPEHTRYLYDLRKSRHPAFLFVMSARDLARFGLLYLRQGKWRDRQIIPAEWIEQSMVAYSSTKRINRLSGYGYLWWIGKDRYAALGSGGQTLVVIPRYQLVIVHLAEKLGKSDPLAHHQVGKLVELILEARPAIKNRRPKAKRPPVSGAQ